MDAAAKHGEIKGRAMKTAHSAYLQNLKSVLPQNLFMGFILWNWQIGAAAALGRAFITSECHSFITHDLKESVYIRFIKCRTKSHEDRRFGFCF